jgi:excisionase family DNA binding protein
MNNLPALLSTDDVADYLMVSPVTIRRFVKRGDLSAYQIGNEYRFQESDIQEFINNRYVPARNQPSKMVERILKSPQYFVGDKRLTQRARQVLAHAGRIAEQKHMAYTSWSDVWEGLLEESNSLAARVIQEEGLAYHADNEPEMDFAEQAGVLRDLLIQASRESFPEADEKQYLGTEHLLMALTRLPMIDADPDSIRETILKHLESSESQADEQAV